MAAKAKRKAPMKRASKKTQHSIHQSVRDENAGREQAMSGMAILRHIMHSRDEHDAQQAALETQRNTIALLAAAELVARMNNDASLSARRVMVLETARIFANALSNDLAHDEPLQPEREETDGAHTTE